MTQEKSIADAFRTDGTDTVTFLPEPDPRPRHFPIISVDDHLVEPPGLFAGRLPSKFADRAPMMVERDDGRQVWRMEGLELPNIGLNAVAGRPPAEYTVEPARTEDMRRGCWDIHSRIYDMDINGVYASICFPSMLAGFAGQRFSELHDQDLGLATLRAWNDWHLEEWCGAYPDRMIPCQITWFNDPNVAADEVRRNAEQGFKALSFTESPHKLGYPSLYSGHWDPLIAACVETETVICLHVGSSSTTPTTSPDAPPDVAAALFPMSAWHAAVDWVYSKVALKFPDVRIVLTEGGVSWVPGLIDRMKHSFKYHEFFGTWVGETVEPVEILKRNFYFCALDDPAGFALRHYIGVDHILVEADYPHGDGTWPNTQEILHRQMGDATDEEIALMTHGNASRLFRHPVDPSWMDAPVHRVGQF